MMNTIWLETCRGVGNDIISKCIRLETRNQNRHELLATRFRISDKEKIEESFSLWDMKPCHCVLGNLAFQENKLPSF